MRLIDADELGEVVDSHGNVHWEDIEKAPTIDAFLMSELEDIKAEIKTLAKDYDYYADTRRKYGLWKALDIIDRHISGKGKE